jgi:hypothetical protein
MLELGTLKSGVSTVLLQVVGTLMQYSDGPSALIAPLYAKAYPDQHAAAPMFVENTKPYLEFVAAVGAKQMPVQVFYLQHAETEYFLIQVSYCRKHTLFCLRKHTVRSV